MTVIKIHIETDLPEALDRADKEVQKNAELAGIDTVTEILDTEGVRVYPPLTAANRPPVPYYIRGTGMQTKSGNLNNSERYGSSWVTTADKYVTVSTNLAKYGIYLGDDQKQAGHMAAIGWKKLKDAVEEKTERVKEIWDKWLKRAIEKSGL